MKISIGRIPMAFLDQLGRRIWEEVEKDNQYVDSDRKREFAEDRAAAFADYLYDSMRESERTRSKSSL